MVARQHTPDYLPGDTLARSDFAEACAGRKLGAILRIALAQGGPGFSKNHLARRCQMTPSQVQDYMFRGRTALSLEIFERVADGLHIPGKMLGIGDRPWETGNDGGLDDRQPADWAFKTPWTAAGTLASAREVSEVNPVDRRSFIFLSGAAITAPAHDWLIARPVNDISHSGGRPIGPGLVDDLDDMTGKLRRMDDQMGGGSLIDMVNAQARYVASLLRDGVYTDSVGRRLHGTLGELLRLGGWVCLDGGDYPRAQRLWLAALHAAHTSGDRALGGNVLGFMSDLATRSSVKSPDRGQLDDAVKLTETALTGYKGSSPRVSAILHMREALAYARRGDAGPCKQAIDTAYNSFRNSAPESGEPDWCYWMDEGMINEEIGTSLIFLGEYSSAADHLKLSLRADQNAQVRETALRLTRLATVHVRQGEPEQACESGGKAIDTLSQIDSPRVASLVQQLRSDLRFYQNVPAVQEFNDKADRLTTGKSQ